MLRLLLAGVAQLVEHELPKLGVAGSNPVSRSGKTSDLATPGPSSTAPADPLAAAGGLGRLATDFPIREPKGR